MSQYAKIATSLGGQPMTAPAPPPLPVQNNYAKIGASLGGQKITPPAPVPEKKKRSVKDIAREGADILWSGAKRIPQAMVEDIKYGPVTKFAKGIASGADTGFYPIRKGLEWAAGKDFKTSAELFPQTPKDNRTYNTPAQKAVGEGAEMAGTMVGTAIMGRGWQAVNALAKIPYFSKGVDKVLSLFGPVGTTKELGKMATIGGGTGFAGSSVHDLSQGAIPKWAADITAGIGLPIAHNKALKKSLNLLEHGQLTNAEKDVIGMLKGELTEKEFNAILPGLKGYEAPVAGFKPTTAEIVKTPYIAQQAHSLQSLGPDLAESAGPLKQALHDMTPGQHTMSSVVEALQGKQAANVQKAEDAYTKMLKQAEAADKRNAIKASKEAAKKGKPLQKQVDKLNKKTVASVELDEHGIPIVINKNLKGEQTKQAGETIRESIKTPLKEHTTHRKEEGKKIYQEGLEKETGTVGTPTSFNHLNHQIDTVGVQGSARGYLEKIRRALLPKKKDMRHELEDIYEGQGWGDPMIEAIDQPDWMNPSQVDKLMTYVSNLGKKAHAAGDWAAREALDEIGVRLKMDADTATKSIANARSQYTELSKPINQITKQEKLKKAISKKDRFSPYHDVEAAKLPGMFTETKGNVEGATQLKKLLKGNKEGQEVLNKHIHDDFVKAAIDAEGKFVPSKIQAYMQKNPGAFILSPDLKKQAFKYHKQAVASKKHLQEVKRLEKQLERIGTSNVKSQVGQVKKGKAHTKEEALAFDSVLGHGIEGITENKIASYIMGKANPGKRVETIMQTIGDNPAAHEGLKRSLHDHLLGKIDFKFPTKENISLLRNVRTALKHVYSPEEMKTYDGFVKALENRSVVQEIPRAKGPGTSQNFEKISERRNWLDKGLLAAARSSKVPRWIKRMGVDTYAAGIEKNQEKVKNLTKDTFHDFLAHPDYAKKILENQANHEIYDKTKQRLRTQILPFMAGNKDE